MAEKILNTRVQLRYDQLSVWQEKNPLLKPGEVAIAYLATSEMKDGTTGAQHPVLFKVGPGNFNNLPFVSALAADVYGWAKKTEEEFTTWVKGLIEVSDIDAYSKKEVDDKLSANSTADQTYAKNYTDTAIAGLDATVSQTAGADGLALSITEVDGVITTISGSIAANTYDAYGSAATAQSAAATDATNKANAAQAAAEATAAADATAKANAAQTAAESHADGLNTAMAARVKELEDHKEDYKAYAEAEADAAEAAAKQDAANKLTTARTEITAEISKAISDSATTEGGVIAGVKADVAEAAEAAAAAQETANEGVTKAEAAQIAADAAQKTIDDFLTGENVSEAVDTLKEIQEELKTLGEAVDLTESFAKKADKVTGATAGNFAGLDANGNLTDSGKKAADFATAEQGAKAEAALPEATFTSTIANYYTKAEAEEAFMDSDEVADAIATAMGNHTAAEYLLKSEAPGYEDILTKTLAGTTYEPIGAENRAIAAAKTETENQVKTLADGAVAKNAGDISTINALLATYGDIVTHNVAEFATAAQGAKADSALQNIEAGLGLAVTEKANGVQTISFDDTITFVFNCGNAESKPLANQ